MNMLVLISIFSASSHCLQRGACLPRAWAERCCCPGWRFRVRSQQRTPFIHKYLLETNFVQGSTGAWFSLELPCPPSTLRPPPRAGSLGRVGDTQQEPGDYQQNLGCPRPTMLSLLLGFTTWGADLPCPLELLDVGCGHMQVS